MFSLKNINKKSAAIVILSLILIMYISVLVRISTLSSPTVLDYDPWYFYRQAENIIKNNMMIPKWDYLSYYPPGRPIEPYEGWPYTIAVFYKIASAFSNISLMEVAKWAPLIMVFLTPIPAFLLGRLLINKWAGITTAFFATLSPAFITVSMGGYADNDAPEVFFFFLSVYSIILAMKRKKPLYYGFSVFTNILFVFSWGGGWLPSILFLAFIPAYLVFRVVEEMAHNKKFAIHPEPILKDFREIIKPLLITIALISVVGYLLGFGSPIHSLIGGLGFTGLSEGGLIVNVSVAELQPLNVFTREGFLTVVSRIGLAPTILTLFFLPILVIYKLLKKRKMDFPEIFLFLWALVAYYLITRGVRFSLLFSIASAITAGYVIGNATKYERKNIMAAGVFGLVAFLMLISVSDALTTGLANNGLQISQNWYDMLNWLKQNADKDSLISTWWDPGHIIAGYTGLKVHADGAHCDPSLCVPYNHNIRIRDMGKLLSTSDEKEAANILKKYKELTPNQCQRAKDMFKGVFPDDACKPVSDIYLIASSDLIGKYYWLSYFGSYDAKTKIGQGKNFATLSASKQEADGSIVYGNGAITLALKDGKPVPIASVNGQSALIRNLVIIQNNNPVLLDFASGNSTQQTVDGLLWVDAGFRNAVYMEGSVRDSLFTKMFFFNGAGLSKFKLVYQNPEIKVFKVDLS